MSKRLHMTNADYVAIAVSPALIMALITSLVFFLLEVLYVGQYQARLNYVFALFIFAAVLIARIAIEMGSERAALFALPLGIATFMVLTRFVEHPSPLSPLINLALLGIVWWCAHKLTWDCTLIDDNEDASGEGLMQRIGIDDADDSNNTSIDHELVSEQDRPEQSWWGRWTHSQPGPHTPGLWVLYFSLAALPLFGFGQRWIPTSDIGRRQYVFSLLFVYVASGLSLLVTTSFLGLRRYLRQRSLEMPTPMAATWLSVGGVLIVLVMLVAVLLPRPHAEYAISQVPWQLRSPEGLKSSRRALGNDGANPQDQSGSVVLRDGQGQQGSVAEDHQREDATAGGGKTEHGNRDEMSGQSESFTSQQKATNGDRNGDAQQTDANEESSGNEQSDQASRDSADRSSSNSGKSNSISQNRLANQRVSSEQTRDSEAVREYDNPAQGEDTQQEHAPAGRSLLEHSNRVNPSRLLEQLPSMLGGLAGILKTLFYIVVGLLLVYWMWTNRQQLHSALFEIIQQIRLLLVRLFGGQTTATDSNAEEDMNPTGPRRRSFSDYRDPFITNKHRQDSPAELVRYTFDAFEAWCNDAGFPRTPDRTPHELVRIALEPQTPLHDEARRLVRLYSELAYARRNVSRAMANELRPLWTLMRTTQPRTQAAALASDGQS